MPSSPSDEGAERSEVGCDHLQGDASHQSALSALEDKAVLFTSKVRQLFNCCSSAGFGFQRLPAESLETEKSMRKNDRKPRGLIVCRHNTVRL